MKVDDAAQIKALTGIKGIACIVVMLNHFSGVFYMPGNRPWEMYPWATIWFNGTFMVYVFFLLSAFFTARTVIYKGNVKGELEKRLFMRYFRLAIPVFAVCLIIFVLQHLNAYQAYDQVKEIVLSTRKESDAANYYRKEPIINVLKTALMAPIATTTKFTFVIWMLPIIYRGFFISVILSLIVRPLKIFPAMTVFVVGAGCFYVTRQFEYIIFVVAVMLAYIYMQKEQVLQSKFANIVGIIGICVGVFVGNCWPNATGNNLLAERLLGAFPSYIPLYVIGAAAIVVGAILVTPIRKLCSTKLSAFLGDSSFGIYLLHDMMQVCIGANVFMIIFTHTNNVEISRVVAFLSSTACTIAGGYLFGKYVDRPVGVLIAKGWKMLQNNRG